MSILQQQFIYMNRMSHFLKIKENELNDDKIIVNPILILYFGAKTFSFYEGGGFRCSSALYLFYHLNVVFNQ